MTQEEIAQYLKAKADLDFAEVNCFFEKAELQSLHKNEHLIEAGDVNTHFILIK